MWFVFMNNQSFSFIVSVFSIEMQLCIQWSYSLPNWKVEIRAVNVCFKLDILYWNESQSLRITTYWITNYKVGKIHFSNQNTLYLPKHLFLLKTMKLEKNDIVLQSLDQKFSVPVWSIVWTFPVAQWYLVISICSWKTVNCVRR